MANLSSIISFRFLAVKDNLLSLKILSLDIIADLILAHKKLQALAWHLIKKTKKYNRLLELFGTTTKLKSLEALLDILIGQKSWQSFLVL